MFRGRGVVGVLLLGDKQVFDYVLNGKFYIWFQCNDFFIGLDIDLFFLYMQVVQDKVVFEVGGYDVLVVGCGLLVNNSNMFGQKVFIVQCFLVDLQKEGMCWVLDEGQV